MKSNRKTFLFCNFSYTDFAPVKGFLLAYSMLHVVFRHANRCLVLLNASLTRRVRAWLAACLAASLLGCLAASLLGCFAASLLRCFASAVSTKICFVVCKKKTKTIAGKSNWLARQAHNLEIVGSSPTPAQKICNVCILIVEYIFKVALCQNVYL